MKTSTALVGSYDVRYTELGRRFDEYHEAGQLLEAGNFCSELLVGLEKDDPDDLLIADAQFYQARAFVGLNADLAAMQVFVALFERYPLSFLETGDPLPLSYPAAAFDYAALLTRRGEAKRAQDIYRRLLAHNAGNIQARFNLTYLALESNNPEQVGLQPLLFSTLPRSGTWYAYHVFEFIERSLGRKPAPYQPGQLAILILALSNLNLLKAHLHAVYPDFASVYDGPHAQRWRDLPEVPYYEPARKDLFDLTCNAQARIIYQFRNPLDQFVSLYNYYKRIEESKLQIPESLEEFAVGAGTSNFIKQYFSFSAMQARFPDRILMVEYEKLMADPRAEFTRMFGFLGLDTGRDGFQTQLASAIAASSLDEMAALEKAGKKSSGAPLLPGQSHMAGGATGRWRKHLSEATVREVAAQLARFDIDLYAFDLDPAQPG